MLLVAFPSVDLGRGLDVSYGIDDTGLVYQNPAGVYARVFFDREQVASVHAADEAGWKYLWIGAGSRQNRQAIVTILIETPNDRGRHFAFSFSTRAWWPW